MIVLAKSDPPQSLRDHLIEVKEAITSLLTPERFAVFSRFGIGEQQAQTLVLNLAWLHDFGKATKEWQAGIRTSNKLPQHSLTSFFACLWALGITRVEEMLPEQVALSLAVLAHHGQLSKDSFRRETFHTQQVSILSDVWTELAREHNLPFDQSKLLGPISSERLCSYVDQMKSLCPVLARQMPFRGLYCLLLALLVDADHAASGGVKPTPRSIGMPNIPGTPTTFQCEVRHKPEDVLCAVAGCGSGKTAAALLRAAEFATQNRADRIVLCLPTRFTSNSLLRDMSDPSKYAYPQDQVGLIHAEALQVLQSQTSQDEEQDFPNTREERIYRRIGIRYEHPITISTVDHLLMSLFHGYRFSDRAFGNLMSSVVVFDEVHAYDATTLNAIREALAVLKEHSIPTLFMSATLPSTRRNFFGITERHTIIERDNPYRSFVVEQVAETLTKGSRTNIEVTETARKLLREAKGLKLAVYVNQVERAKALAIAASEEIEGVRVYCYHSELAPRDRIKLEGRIIRAFKNWRDRPVVLIATQAAELSLDISADRMITELASADVLVQRAGRLHRRGLTPVQQESTQRLPAGFAYKLFIAPLEISNEPDVPQPAALPYKDVALLHRTWETAPWNEIFTFERGLRWCEESLIDIPPVRVTGLQQATLDDAVFGNKPQQNFGEDGNEGIVTIRDRDEEPCLVVPEIYYHCLGDTLTEITPYQVPLRRSKYYAIKQEGFIEKRTVTVILAKGNKKREKRIDYTTKSYFQKSVRNES